MEERIKNLLEEMIDVMIQVDKSGTYLRSHIWTDGIEFMCDTEARANAVFDFLEALGMEPHIGYYDPVEDRNSNEVDHHTGWYYVDFD